MALALIATLSACEATGPIEATFSGKEDFEQALATCGVTFDDFYWYHDISGAVTFHPTDTSKATTAQRDCVRRWAERTETYTYEGDLSGQP